jgi:uncharacterized membrane protein
VTKIQTGLTLTALAVTAAFIVLPSLVTDAKASTTSQLLNCRYDTRQKVMDCCQHVLRTNTRPYWISSGAGSCSAVAKCVGGGKQPTSYAAAVVPPKAKKCFIAIPLEDAIGGGKSSDPGPSSRPEGQRPGQS